METDVQFSNVNMLKEVEIGTDEMMVMLINLLSSSIKTYYKKIKMTIKEIDFETKNVDDNKEKVDMIGKALKNFVNEAKEIFVKLKTNHKQGRNRSIECDKSNNSYSLKKNNFISSNRKKSNLEIITKVSNPFEKGVISTLNCSINSNHNNSSLNANKYKHLHKSKSTRNSSIKSCTNELICLVKEIISKIKEIFPNGKYHDNIKNDQMKNIFSLLNQLINMMTSTNKNSKSPSTKFQSQNNSIYLSPVHSPLLNNTSKKIFINGLNSHHYKKNKLSLNKHQKNNSNSISTIVQQINLNDISHSSTLKDIPHYNILNNSINSHVYWEENSKSKYNNKTIPSKNTNIFIKELQDKIQLLEGELRLKNQEIKELQFNTNSIDNTIIELKTRNVRKHPHVKSSSIGEFDDTTFKDTLNNVSKQSEMQFIENEEKLQKRINELNDIIVKQQYIIDNGIRNSKNLKLIIDNNVSLDYNMNTSQIKNNDNEEIQSHKIKNIYISKNEITNFNFDICKNISQNNTNQFEDKEKLILMEKDKLQEELKIIIEKNKVISESYEQLINNLSFKEISLSESKDEITNLTNQIKSLQFKLFHLENNIHDNQKKDSSSNSKEKVLSSKKKSHYHNLSKDKLISNIEILKTENDKFAKECARLQNDINTQNIDYLELQAKYIQLNNNYEKQIKENENTISDLKETLKHKSEMLLTQATEIENFISAEKMKDKIIKELKNEIKTKEKVSDNFQMKRCELLKQSENFEKKDNIHESAGIEKKDLDDNLNFDEESYENIEENSLDDN